MNKTTAVLLSGAAVLGAAMIGRRAGPEHPREALWYAALDKPSFTPPGAVIGVAWTTLDVLLGVAGARLLHAPSSRERSVALLFWSLNLAGVAGYPWVFFKQKRLGTSAVVVAGMLASARAAVSTAGKVDRVAAVASMPLIGWLAFAGLLSEELWRRNPLLDRD